MSITLITGALQSGKSRRLGSYLRDVGPGRGVLIRPVSHHDHEAVGDWVSWAGPGLMPPTVGWAALVERLCASTGIGPALSSGSLRHLLRGWCAAGGLVGTTWEGAARFRRTANELAELVERCDDHRLSDADLDLATVTARRRGDVEAAERIATLRSVRRQAVARAAERGRVVSGGARLMALAAAAPAAPWAMLAFDDFLAFTPAELHLIGTLGRDRDIYIAAVDDHRLGEAGPAARLRAAFPDAHEERLNGIHEEAPHSPQQRALISAALDPEAGPGQVATEWYHERDPWHAGRAISAWLRRSGTAPADAGLFVRAADLHVEGLVAGLRAAGVPVQARLSLPLGASLAGALLAEAGRYCQRPRWDGFLRVCTRLAALGRVPPAPVRLLDLEGPWASEPPATALAALSAADLPAEWLWNDPRKGAWRTAAVAWLRERFAAFPTSGSWVERLTMLVRAWDLGDGCGQLVAQLADLAELGPVTADDLDDLIANARIDHVIDDGPTALVVHDAVRGRSRPRPVAIIHGLAHGQWPRRTRPGCLIGPVQRATLARDLGRDLFDQAGQESGELAAFLAVCARATTTTVIGIPCGEREPSAWVAALLAQAGGDLEHERQRAAAEVVPGAPLGSDDSMGAHELALWHSAPRQPPRLLRVPVTAPDQLGLRPSRLNQVVADSFSVWCDKLALQPILAHAPAIAAGQRMHALLAEVVVTPPAQWPNALRSAAARLRSTCRDAADEVAFDRLVRRIGKLLARECGDYGRPTGGFTPVPAGATCATEVAVQCALTLPDGRSLTLKGRVDRIDLLPDGSRRVVDWKLGSAGEYRSLIKAGQEGQLAAYAAGLAADGQGPVTGAWYATVADGKNASYPDAVVLSSALTAVAAAIVTLAGGEASVDEEGVSGQRYAPIVRAAELAQSPAEEDADDEDLS